MTENKLNGLAMLNNHRKEQLTSKEIINVLKKKK